MDNDTAMRLAAFAHVRRLIELRDVLTADDLAQGFQFGGARIPLINPRSIRFATGRRNGRGRIAVYVGGEGRREAGHTTPVDSSGSRL